MPSSSQIFRVISAESGEVVGVQIPSAEADDPRGVHAMLVAGPGQRLAEVEVDQPVDVSAPEAIDKLHRDLRDRLRSSGEAD